MSFRVHLSSDVGGWVLLRDVRNLVAAFALCRADISGLTEIAADAIQFSFDF